MTWNYRIVKKDEHYGIYEVYYSDGKPEAVTMESIAPFGDTFEELVGDFSYMIAAFGEPVLDYEEIGDE